VNDAYAVQTVGLSKRYGSRTVLDGVTMAVRSGSLFGLLGPNGAGKSTLVKILVGLVHPSAGAARILGEPPSRPAVRRHIGYLPELFRYPPWLTARDVLAHHALLAGVAPRDDDLEQLLARVGLPRHMGTKVGAFSKGMQQRLGWAVALVGRPRLLFLDEPTSALDPLGRHDLMGLLRELSADGVTVLLNSHLLADVQDLCDTVGLLHQGRLLRLGDLTTVLSDGGSRFRLRTGPITSEARLALRGWTWAEWPAESGGPGLVVDVPWEQLPLVHRALVTHGVDVFLAEPVAPSLDEWFVTQIRGNHP
jgi:ABC-2 type transport system ATP-binding protein